MIAEKVDADLMITVTAGRNEILRQAEPDDRLLSLLECATPYASVAFDLGAEFLRRFSPKQMEELDYARRKSMNVKEIERWLAPNLAYDPDLA